MTPPTVTEVDENKKNKELKELEKIGKEIELLEANVLEKKRGRGKDFFGSVSAFMAMLVAVIGIPAAVFGLLPDFLKAKNIWVTRNNVSLSGEMVRLANQLDSSNHLLAATMLLYYGKNSIPILFTKLESESDSSRLTNYADAVSQIILYDSDTAEMKDYIVTKIFQRFSYLVKIQLGEQPEYQNFGGAGNHIFLLKNLGLRKADLVAVTEQLEAIKSQTEEQYRSERLNDLIDQLELLIPKNNHRP